MAFIEPMHRNKPNITYLLTYFVTRHHTEHEIIILIDGVTQWGKEYALAIATVGKKFLFFDSEHCDKIICDKITKHK